MRRTIAIAGNIGSGKTSLVEFLARNFDIQPFYEPNEENPYLPDFYQDMQRWAFHSQLYFLASKFRIHQRLDLQPGISSLDRTIFEDAEIFATALHQMGRINARDWQTYQSFYRSILASIRPPDLLIFLRCNPRTLRQRIRLRARPMEQAIPPAYLKRLDTLYESWLERYDLGAVLVIDSDRLDYVNDLVDGLDLKQRLTARLPSGLLQPAPANRR